MTKVSRLRLGIRPSLLLTAPLAQAPRSTYSGAESRPLPVRHHSTWRAVPCTETTSLKCFQKAFRTALPVRLPRGAVDIDARGTWLTKDNPPALATTRLRERYPDLVLPMELTMSGTDTFHRADSAPFSLFLDALESSHEPGAPRIYVAQSPLRLLPADLLEPFKTPEYVTKAANGDVYDSSLWLGLPPTSTPLHRDPNPNLFVQIAGSKIIRLMPPDAGSRLYSRVRDGQTGGGFGADERIRGEEMMKGAEKERLEAAIWRGDGHSVAEGYEAWLEPGDSLLIPLGWWHAVRSAGSSINMSVNWWFR